MFSQQNKGIFLKQTVVSFDMNFIVMTYAIAHDVSIE